MVTATRCGAHYDAAITNDRFQLFADTCKDEVGGQAGMRPHELPESALAAGVSISIDIAAERAGLELPAATVDVTLDRRDDETRFNVTVRYAAALSDAGKELVRTAVLDSPVARTLSKPVSVRLEAIATF